MDEAIRRAGPPRILEETEEVIETCRRLGREGKSHQGVADHFGCHKDTVRNFFARAPLAKAAYKEGLAEYLAENGRKAPRENPELLPDFPDVCPTCGGRLHQPDETVTFTRAELDEARRAFDELVARHLAARNPAGHGGELE